MTRSSSADCALLRFNKLQTSFLLIVPNVILLDSLDGDGPHDAVALVGTDRYLVDVFDDAGAKLELAFALSLLLEC